MTCIWLILLLLLFYGALRAKMRTYKFFTQDIIPSPASRALTEVVGIAGGVYLSLVMMVSFLKLQIPETVSLGGWSVDPLALLAIIVALVQPIFAERWATYRRR